MQQIEIRNNLCESCLLAAFWLWHALCLWNWERPQVHAHGLASTFPFLAYQTLHPSWKNAEQCPTLQLEKTQSCPPILVGFHFVGEENVPSPYASLGALWLLHSPVAQSCSFIFHCFSFGKQILNNFLGFVELALQIILFCSIFLHNTLIFLHLIFQVRQFRIILIPLGLLENYFSA